MVKSTDKLPKGGQYRKGSSFYWRSMSEDWRNRYGTIVKAQRNANKETLRRLNVNTKSFEPVSATPYSRNPRTKQQAIRDIKAFKRGV